MTKEKISYITLIIQAAFALLFAISLYFILPHQFSLAFNHYIALGPFLHGAYIVSMAISILNFIFLFIQKVDKKLLILLAFAIILGIFTYPSILLLYSSIQGMNATLVKYNIALLVISIYLSLLFIVGLNCLLAWKGKTNKWIMVGLIVLSFVINGVCYLNYYEVEDVHLTENLNYRFVGTNGKGSVEIVDNSISVDHIYANFSSSLKYEIGNNGSLSNGEQVAITVTYDTELAKKLNLNVIDAVETVEVSGLREFYKTYKDVPTLIVEEARDVANVLVQKTLAEKFPDRESTSAIIGQYYVRDDFKINDNPYALVFLYRITYQYQGLTYYYYRACHVENVHSDALKDFTLLTPILSQETFKSAIFENGKTEMTVTEAKAHAYAMLTNHFDEVEEVIIKNS